MEDLKQKTARRLDELLDYAITNYQEDRQAIAQMTDVSFDDKLRFDKEMLYVITEIANKIGWILQE